MNPDLPAAIAQLIACQLIVANTATAAGAPVPADSAYATAMTKTACELRQVPGGLGFVLSLPTLVDYQVIVAPPVPAAATPVPPVGRCARPPLALEIFTATGEEHWLLTQQGTPVSAWRRPSGGRLAKFKDFSPGELAAVWHTGTKPRRHGTVADMAVALAYELRRATGDGQAIAGLISEVMDGQPEYPAWPYAVRNALAQLRAADADPATTRTVLLARHRALMQAAAK